MKINENSVELLGEVRVMMFNEHPIHYFTGISPDEIFVSMYDIGYIVEDTFKSRNYLDIIDIANMMIKAKILPKHILYHGNICIGDYINNQCITISTAIKFCEYYGMKDLLIFLREAYKVINEYGSYVPIKKYHYNRKKNRELNLSDELERNTLINYGDDFFYNSDLYYEVVDRILLIVFNKDMNDIRYKYRLYDDEKLSDFISDKDFNKISLCCVVFNYMMKYNKDLSLDYISMIAEIVLNNSKDKIKSNTKQDVDLTNDEYEEEKSPYLEAYNKVNEERDNEDNDIKQYRKYQ